jgi:PAS domain S-box-containing protein
MRAVSSRGGGIVARSAERAAPVQAELDLEDFFENGNVGLHLVGPDGTILRANPADYAPLGYSAEEYVGHNIAEFHVDDEVISDILARLGRGERLDRYPARLRARDGSIRHVEVSSSVRFECGAFRNTRCFTVDVTERKRAEEALRETQNRLDATFESAVAGIAEVAADGSFIRVNEAVCALTGYTKEELCALSFFDLTHPDDAVLEKERWESLLDGREDRLTIEKRYIRKDGRVVWVQVMNSAVRRSDGSFAFGVKMFEDVTERKAGEARQRLLLDELNHRVKNTLATVQSLAAHTARGCSTVAEFRARFEPRLLALSAAHDRLTRRQWDGASLREIVDEELAAHAAPGRTVATDGPDVHLPPRASLSLSMALHELATNAAKHGALSAPGGTVELHWEVEKYGAILSAVALEWRERGGPPVEAPAVEGFGSRLLRVTARELQGEMSLDYAPEGLHWRLHFPIPAAHG